MSKSLLSFSLLVSLLLIGTAAWAQRQVTGRITSSEDGSGLPGVYIVVKGTTIGAASDVEGNYKLSVPDDPNTQLEFSSIGFKTQVVPIGSSSGGSINIVLELDVQQLNEAVVVGYGTVSKKDLTGSVVAVSRKDFQQGLISTPEQLIAGKIAGVQITPGSGAPGSGAQIRIRGGSSLSASNDPLYVIDGVPIDNSNVGGVANPLALINPNDIETFTVLKDASATAIYGSRASNGVIIITTRKGLSNSKPTFSFSTNNSVSTLIKKVGVLSGDQLRKVLTDSGEAQVAFLGKANTDWQKEIYQTALSSDNQLSIGGGVFNTPYRLSLGYLVQQGILKTDKLERPTVSLQLNPSLFDGQLKINLNIKGAATKTRFAAGAIGNAISYDPTQNIYASDSNPQNTNQDPTRFGGYNEWVVPATGRTPILPNGLAPRNPLGLLNQREDIFYVRRSIGNAQFDYSYKGIPGLRANLNLGYDVSSGQGTVRVSDSAAASYLYQPNGLRGGEYREGKNVNRMGIIESYLAYAKEFANLHSRIDVIAGHSYQEWQFTSYTPYSLSYKGDTISTRKPSSAFPNNTEVTRLESYYARLNYALFERYLLTGTIRSDASSRFNPNNRVGIFPSMAVSWKINDEAFLKNQTVVSNLKLRLGYGLTGQQDGINRYPYQFRYLLSNQSAQYQLGNQYYQLYRPTAIDPNLKWETTATYNGALDFGFLKDRISGSVDFYYRKTYDLLNTVNISSGNFSDQVLTNVGNLENKGVELLLNTRPVQTKDFSWDLGINLTVNRNKITKLNIAEDSATAHVLTGGIGLGQTVQTLTVGQPLGTFYVYQQKYGDDGKPLDGQFVNQNGDKDAKGVDILNDADRIEYKSTQPKFYYGINTQVSYKQFSLSAVLRGSEGGYIYNNVSAQNGTLRAATVQSNYVNNITSDYLETGITGRINTTQQLQSSHYVQKANFIRCDNLSLGYNVGDIVPKHLSARVNFTVQNLFLITPYKGIDPEQAGGIDNNFYPRPRTFVISLNFDVK